MSRYGRFAVHRWLANVKPSTFRRIVRFFPAVHRTGVRVRHIADDWQTWELELPLSYRTINYVGTHFGGTLYAAADPWPMLAWMHILPNTTVWDKAATVRFVRPGRGHLRMTMRITDEDIMDVRAALASGSKFDRTYVLEWKDDTDNTVAVVEKVVHFRPASPTPFSES